MGNCVAKHDTWRRHSRPHLHLAILPNSKTHNCSAMIQKPAARGIERDGHDPPARQLGARANRSASKQASAQSGPSVLGRGSWEGAHR